MSDQRAPEIWLRTDEVEEFIDALERSADFLGAVASDLRLWKWAIIALHQALQGAFICALVGHHASSHAVFGKKVRKEYLRWHEEGRTSDPKWSEEKQPLASFLELFERIKDPDFLPEPHRLDASPEIDPDDKRLNELRNDFIHFLPQGLALEVSGMPRIARHSSEIIAHLAIEKRAFRLNDEKARQVLQALHRIGVGLAEFEKAHRLA